ncbi:MAG: archaetidylserine decarboxylase [Sulfuriferula sp.]
MSEQFSVLLQYLMPRRAINVLAGKMANSRHPGLAQYLIRWFLARYDVNMLEAADPDIRKHASYNEFFSRALRSEARPLSAAEFVSPVDGAISQFGAIASDQIFQAKGHHYSTVALLGGDAALAAQFRHGSFATLYLSPKDYHRVHMPCDGRLLRMIYVPGDLFSVNPVTARGVPGLFARNERVVCVFETAQKTPFVLTLVGASIVGSMATVWHGIVNPPRTGRIREWQYDNEPITLQKGEEMGRFLLGSTVVLLFPKGTLHFNPAWAATRTVRMGETMGTKFRNNDA